MIWKDLKVGDFVYHVVDVPIREDDECCDDVEVHRHRVEEINGTSDLDIVLSGRDEELTIYEFESEDNYALDPTGPFYLSEEDAMKVRNGRVANKIHHAQYMIERHQSLIEYLQSVEPEIKIF